jgi:cell division protein FtsX
MLGGAAAIGLAAALSAWLGYELRALTPGYATELKIIFLDPMESLWVLGGAAGLGLLGAWRAVGRELRQFASPR